MKKFIKIFFPILILIGLTTYIPSNERFSKSIFFPINNIIIENNNVINSKNLENDLKFLKNQSLLFVENQRVKKELLKNEFLNGFEIKKQFPSTIKIIIYEKVPIAINFQEKKKFFLFENGEKANFFDIEIYSNLPVVIGNSDKFINLRDNLKFVKFPINLIESFHFFKIGRWDIHLENNIIIKLPKDWYTESLKNYLQIKDNKSFENYKIFDYRIKDQLILN